MNYKELWKMKNGSKVIKEHLNNKTIHYEYLDTNKLALNKRYFDMDKIEKISTTFEFIVTIQINNKDTEVLKINNNPIENTDLFNAVKNYIASTGYTS